MISLSEEFIFLKEEYKILKKYYRLFCFRCRRSKYGKIR